MMEIHFKAATLVPAPPPPAPPPPPPPPQQQQTENRVGGKQPKFAREYSLQ